MVKMELVRDPGNMEDSFVRVEIDGNVSVYRQTEFEVDVCLLYTSPRPRD